nr:beta-L-arabinofuranosidase domain-containing protein [Maribellus luteus]
MCCVGNINRSIPNYIMHMWMTTLDNGIAANLYGPSVVSTTVNNGVGVRIKAETDYPFKEDIALTVFPDSKTEFPLHLRIPGWCKNPSIQINCEDIIWDSNEKGFAVIKRTWQKEDKVNIHFPMNVKIFNGRETPYPQVEYFKNNREQAKLDSINNPFQSLYYGPLLLALPLPDMGTNSTLKAYDGTYNFALNIDSKKLREVIHKQEMKRTWHWQMESTPLKVRVQAKMFNWEPTELQPLPQDFVSMGKDTTIALVPYGLTKYRISMFPICE